MPFEELKDALSVTLTIRRSNFSSDISKTHLFLGYKPLIIGIVFPLNEANSLATNNEAEVCLNFHRQQFSINMMWQGFPSSKNCIARLLLKKISEKTLGQHRITFYEGVDAWHSFIDPVHQFVNRQREKLGRNNPGNVSLPGTLHDMVRIAYSFPRVISLITLSDGKKMNLFPTDLHGAISEKFYVSSLRKGGKANDQVEQLRKLVVSNIDVNEFRLAYSLGKNHMMDLQEQEHFDCNSRVSEIYKLPLPSQAIRYRELKQLESFDIGIHRIHVYENIRDETIREGLTLAHIHQFYAQWRIDHNLPVRMLIR